MGIFNVGSSEVGGEDTLGSAGTPPVHPDPIAVIVTDTSIGDSPLSIAFDGSTSTGVSALSYLWNFGDGSASSPLETVTHTYATPGIYVATLTVTDAEEYEDSAVSTIIVSGGNGTFVLAGDCTDCVSEYVMATLEWVDESGVRVGDPLVSLYRSFLDEIPEVLPTTYTSATYQGASSGFTVGETVRLGTTVEVPEPPVGAVSLVATLRTPVVDESFSWGINWEIHDSEVFVCETIVVEPPDIDANWSVDSAILGESVSYVTEIQGLVDSAELQISWPFEVYVDTVRVNGLEVLWNDGLITLGNIDGLVVVEVVGRTNSSGTFEAISVLSYLGGSVSASDTIFVPIPPSIGKLIVEEDTGDCWFPTLLDNNLYKGEDFSFDSSVGNWEIITGNASLTPSHTKVLHSDINSLRVTSDSTPFTLASARYVLPPRFMNRYQRSFIWVWAPRQVTVGMTFTATRFGVTQTVSDSVSVRGNQWQLVSLYSSNRMSPDGETILRTKFEIFGQETGDAIYFAAPGLTVPGFRYENSFSFEVWDRLPAYMTDEDALQVEPRYPLGQFINVLYITAGQIERIWAELRYIAPDEVSLDPLETRSKLVDPDICCIKFLNWLGTLVGVKIEDNSTGFTAWDDLAFQDLTSDIPQPLQDWDEWETEPDQPPSPNGDNDGVVTWGEIESFDDSESNDYDYWRWQVKTAVSGLRGGTQDALAESVRRVLRGNKQVRIVRHVGGDPWQIRVETLVEETPGVKAVDESSLQVMKALSRVIPAGYGVEHRSVGLQVFESESYGDPGIYGTSYAYGSNIG
jgi:PKD repeat protein